MSRPGLVRLVYAVAFAGFLMECLLLFGYTMDDAFISFRYARNLERGEGLVYNAGEPPVEGYSNFLWTILFAPVIGAGLDPEFISKVLGILCGLGVLGATILLSRRLDGDSDYRCLGPVLVGTSPIMAMQSITGLETPLFGLFFLLGLWLTLRETERPRRLPLSALAFLGCALTRPEGVALFAASLLAAVVVMGFRSGEGRLRRPSSGWLVLSILFFGAPYGVYTIWRMGYFGSLLPNTFYAKTSGASQIAGGWDYLKTFSSVHGGFLLYIFILVAVVFRRGERSVRYLAAMAAVFVAMVVYEGGDWMPLFRLFAPVLPVLFLLFQSGVRVFGEALGRRTQASGPPWARETVVAGTVAALLVFSLFPLPATAREAMGKQELYRKAHRAFGLWLARYTPPGEPIALSDIGQFGYYSDLPVIDLVGLTNREIARSQGLLHEKQVNPDVILSKRPAHIVIVCYKNGETWTNRGFPMETALLASNEFKELYGRARLVHYKDDYSYWIFTRKDLDARIRAEEG